MSGICWLSFFLLHFSRDPETQRLRTLVENLTEELERQNATFIKDLERQNATFIKELESQNATFTKEKNKMKTRNEELMKTSRDLNRDIKDLKISYKELEVTNTDLNEQFITKSHRVAQLESDHLGLQRR